MAGRKTTDSVEIDVVQMQQGRITLCVLGSSPLIYNQMSEKARRDLLMPAGRKTAAQKAQNLKHEPMTEYRASVYRRADGEAGPTRLVFPAPAFKAAMANAAKDMPTSVAKAQVGRLSWVEGYSVDVYGAPMLHMSVVRSADMNRTPDIRTRAILPAWACRVTLTFIMPVLSANTVATLMQAAGMVCGIGDWRQEKGSGNHGQFRIVDGDDAEFQRVIRDGGRDVQDAALADPLAYDAATADLLAWFEDERKRRPVAARLVAA